MFAQHSTFGIKLEVDKKFLDYAYRSAETIANGNSESGASSGAAVAVRAAKIAAAAKEQAQGKRVAEAKIKAKAMAKAKAKAKAFEKEEWRLLAEATKVAKAAAEAEAEAKAEVNTLKGVKNPQTKAVEEAAKARPARPMVQARVRSFQCISLPVTQAPASNTQSPHPLPLRTGASGAEKGSDYDD